MARSQTFRNARTLLIAAWLAGTLAAGNGSAQTQSPAIEGEGLSDELADFIADTVGERKIPASPLAARRQAREAGKAALGALNSRGYFAPEIETNVIDAPPLRPVLRITPGPQFRLAKINFDYGSKAPKQSVQDAVRRASQLVPGDLAIPERLLAARARITQALRDESHAFASITGYDILGDRDRGVVDLSYEIDAGPPVAFGSVVYPQDMPVRQSYVEKLVNFTAGEAYAPATLEGFNQRLASTRIFDVARAHLSQTASGETADGQAIYDVELQLQPRARNRVELGASFATDRGFGVDALYTRRNLTGNGDFLTAETTLAEQERILQLQWRQPSRFGYGREWFVRSRITDEDTDAFDRRAVELGTGIIVNRDPRLTYSIGGDVALVRETARVDLKSNLADRRDLQLVTLHGGAQIDRADSVLDPRKGWKADLRIEPTAAFGNAPSQFARTLGQLRAYLPLDDDRHTVLAGRVRMGTAFGATIADLPADRRFFAGGGGSVRGYAFQAIGPRTPDGTPIGGRSLAEMSAELRWRMRETIGLVGFVDGGSVSNDAGFGFEELRLGAGIGARYHTVAGPIRVDVAIPLDRTEFDDSFQVYLSIGQAF